MVSPRSSDAPMDTAIQGIHDLTNDLRKFGAIFIIFSIVFYISVPLFYYHMALQWSFLDSIYFCVVTWATVGYGDLAPTTASQRMFTTVWILIGLCVTGNLIGVISAVLSERRKRMLFRLQKARMHHDKEQIRRSEIWLRTRSLALWAPSFVRKGLKHIRSLFDRITLYDDFIARVVERDRLHDHQDNKIAKLRLHYLQDLQDMRYSVFVNFVWLMVALLVGTYVMVYIEGWDANEGFYWAVVTLATVGYGDYLPTKSSSKIFTCFYIIFGGYALVTVVTSLIWTPIRMLELKNEIKIIRQFEDRMTEAKFTGIVEHPLFYKIDNLKRSDQEISKAEFVLTILNLMNKVRDADIDIASDIFDSIDTNNDGVLTEETKERYLKEVQSRLDDGPESESHHVQLESRLTDNPILHVMRDALSDRNPLSRSGSVSSVTLNPMASPRESKGRISGNAISGDLHSELLSENI